MIQLTLPSSPIPALSGLTVPDAGPALAQSFNAVLESAISETAPTAAAPTPDSAVDPQQRLAAEAPEFVAELTPPDETPSDPAQNLPYVVPPTVKFDTPDDLGEVKPAAHPPSDTETRPEDRVAIRKRPVAPAILTILPAIEAAPPVPPTAPSDTPVPLPANAPPSPLTVAPQLQLAPSPRLELPQTMATDANPRPLDHAHAQLDAVVQATARDIVALTNRDDVRFTILPRALARIDITVDPRPTGHAVHIETADTPSADLLRAAEPQLRAESLQRGVPLGQVTVDLTQRERSPRKAPAPRPTITSPVQLNEAGPVAAKVGRYA